MSGAIKTYTAALREPQVAQLRSLLQSLQFEFEERPYMHYFARGPKVTVAVYEKGPKVVVQGGGTADFVQFQLEPEILKEAKFGYDEVLNPEWFEPHFGIDESGKGDYFGPLVVAGIYVDGDLARQWREAGIQDSKKIGSDGRIRELADMIRKTPGVVWKRVVVGPERYNALMEKMGNLNRLLAWGHARVIEDLTEARPDCPRALSDQFATGGVMKRALLTRGKKLIFEHRTKAESDPAVAAASILARDGFVDWLDKKGRELGMPLPKGAGPPVMKAARKLLETKGEAVLLAHVKAHFRLTPQLIGTS